MSRKNANATEYKQKTYEDDDIEGLNKVSLDEFGYTMKDIQTHGKFLKNHKIDHIKTNINN